MGMASPLLPRKKLTHALTDVVRNNLLQADFIELHSTDILVMVAHKLIASPSSAFSPSNVEMMKIPANTPNQAGAIENANRYGVVRCGGCSDRTTSR